MVATGVVRMQYLRLFGFAVLVLVEACHVYEPGLIRERADASALEPTADASTEPASLDMAAQAATDAGTRGPDAAANADPSKATGSARTNADPQAPRTCGSGDCWWSTDLDADCRSAGRPSSQHRPTSATSVGDSLPAIYLGWTLIDLGGSSAPEDSRPGEWESFGLDLDGVCTNSSSCSSRAQACRAATSEIPFDGAMCRDNRFARLQATLAPVPEIGQRYGLREETFNCNLRRGTYNLIVKLSDYNGQPDDPEVRVDFYSSPGLARLPPWSCDDGDADSYPFWTAGAPWQIDTANLTSEITAPGELPASSIADPKAFVREGYLVADLPDGAQLRLAGASNSYRSFALTTRRSVWTGALRHQQDGTWQVEDGLVAGTTLASDLIETFHELGLCQQPGAAEQDAEQNGFYELVENAIRENADMLADGRVDENASCDALSFAIAFRAAQLTPGAAGMSPERITCCPPGMTAQDCHPECGDGIVSGSEQCDRAIPVGEPGACPIWCTPVNACTPQRVTGTAASCDAHCVPMPITRARAGDGCCPPDTNANMDSDCASQCGNAEVEPGETCEPNTSQSCPTSCKHEDACMLGELSGSAESCDVACNWTRIEQCRDDDGCCPSGCDQTEDDDCDASCGNGVLESGERCENETSTPCPTSCDDGDACTEDTLSGSASECSARCERSTITERENGDGCCPKDANATNDSDCKAVCGNWVRELSEECDDGNQRSGDGCSSDCKRESTGETESMPANDEAICLSLLGNPMDSCSSCICKECEDEVIDCRGASNADEAKQCRDVFSCATAQRCFGTACYCKSGTQCSSPDGPCRKEIEAAAHSSTPSVVFARFSDTKYPLGRVMELTSCFTGKCSSSCTTP